MDGERWISKRTGGRLLPKMVDPEGIGRGLGGVEVWWKALLSVTQGGGMMPDRKERERCFSITMTTVQSIK